MQFLIEKIAIETVVDTVVLAEQYNFTQLKSSCIEFIAANSKEVMQTEGWIKLKSGRNMYADLKLEICEAMVNIVNNQLSSSKN